MYNSFAFNTNIFAQKKFKGELDSMILMFRITYTNFHWQIIKNSCKGVKHVQFLGCTDSRTYEVNPVFICSYRKNIEVRNTKANLNVYV